MRLLSKITFCSIVYFFTIYGAFSQSAEKIERLSDNINSSYNESQPIITPDGKSMYFTRMNHPDNEGGQRDGGDIWVSKLNENNEWGPAEKASSNLNNAQKNSVLAFTKDGNLMYLQNYYSKDGAKAKTNGISYSRKTTSGWSFPEPLAVDYFFNKSENLSATLSKDGQKMILSMHSYGTYGNEDLYVSFLQSNGNWSEPKNLGGTINTAYQELTPFLAEDDVTLYFSSNGLNGEGSKDIFMIRRLDNTWRNWSKPVNLGNSFNSKGMETSYFIPAKGDYAYMVSTQNSNGYGDIGRVKLNQGDRPQNKLENDSAVENLGSTPSSVTVISNDYMDSNPVAMGNDSIFSSSEGETTSASLETIYITLEGKVLSDKNKKPIEATLTFTKLPDGEVIKEMKTNSSEGTYSIQLPSLNVYSVDISAKGYMGKEEKLILDSKESPRLQMVYMLSPIEVGTTIQLSNVLFEQGNANLVDNSYPELDKVIKMLHDNPYVEIELSGHTDNRGDAKLNLKLSQERINRVTDYLVSKGISEDRIKGKGYGGTRPIASNSSEETRKLNRRVEFTIIKASAQ